MMMRKWERNGGDLVLEGSDKVTCNDMNCVTVGSWLAFFSIMPIIATRGISRNIIHWEWKKDEWSSARNQTPYATPHKIVSLVMPLMPL